MTIPDKIFFANDIEFYSFISNTKQFIPVLRKMGLLKEKIKCFKCHKDMSFVAEADEEKSYFRCFKKKCNKYKVSVSKNSILFNKSIGFKNLLLIIYGWCTDTSLEKIIKNTNLSASTILRMAKIFRKIISENTKITKKKIGGPGKNVEIDESAFSKRKYNKGRIVATKWIFGGVCRETGDVFVEEIKDRKKDTLNKLIINNIHTGSIIISDCWKSYSSIKELGFKHYKINHSKNFVDPQNFNIHTQNIENRWSILKKNLKSKGNNIGPSISEYISEYFFKKDNKNTFLSVINLINKSFI